MQCGPAWLFDGSAIPDPRGYGDRAVEFLRFLKHPKSRLADKGLVWDPWQTRIIRKVYGPCHDDGRRVCRVVYLQVGRGNRKTSLGAALALLHTFGPERVPSGQVISAAADRKQARIAFEEAGGIIGQVPQLSAASRIQDFKNRIVHPKSGATYEAISCDAATNYGRTPIFALVDELWAHKKIDLWHAIRTGLTKVAGSLLVITTTAGRGSHAPDFPIYEYARKVMSGEIDDPSFLPIIFEAPRDCDWQDEAIWNATNPGLQHGYPDIEGLRQLAREAKERPADRDAFQQFHLGIRQEHSVSPFVDIATYDEGAAPVDLDKLVESPCWIGVDLSSNNDLTVVVACWRDGDDGYVVWPWFFCPKENLQARADRDGVPYPLWAEGEFITPTPGNVVDFRAVETCIRDLCKRFDVREIAFDPHLARNTLNSLLEDGLPAVEMRQGWITMAPAVKELERAIIGRKLRHGGHPVLRWNFENIAVETDKAGNRQFHKGKSRDRIDGAVACAMAVARASSGESERSIFDRPELWTGNDPAKQASNASIVDGIDMDILKDPRHPQWHAMRERYEARFVDADEEDY
jgi:phage terminase large subunit-like protein